jgi:hypothetical protein
VQNSTTDNTTNAYRSVGADFTGQDIWASVLIDYNPSDGTGNAQLQLRESGGNNDVKVRFADGDLQILNNDFSGFDGVDNVTGAASVSDGVHLLVAQIERDGLGSGDKVNVWLDPDIGEGTVPTPTASTSQGIDFTDQLGLVLIPTVDDPNNYGTYRHDEVRVGESFADVTPVPTPSSASAALIGLGTLLMVKPRPSRQSVK